MHDSETKAMETISRPTFDSLQRDAIFRAACRRVEAAVRRIPADSTRVLLGETADTPVYGTFVTLRRAGRLRACCGYIGASVLLSDALDAAADRAATEDPRFPPIIADELQELHVDVWVLWGPEQVTARGYSRVDAVTIGKHGLQIARGRARGLLLPGVAIEHHFDALTFLQQVCLKAGLPTDAWLDDDTDLWVFEGEAIEGTMPTETSRVRPPAVAGSFYPGTAEEVQRTLDQLFDETLKMPPEPWAGALVPHAGWVYSGHLAASVFNRIAIPDTAIILCPKHRAPGAHWAVSPCTGWQFPGGELGADLELAERLAENITGLQLDAAAHCQEHAIEVQLPLLAYLAPRVRIVGMIVGDAPLADLLRFGRELAGVLREMPQRPLLIISSDMNHFADDRTTRRVDRIALDAIATLDPTCIYETIHANRISMCGAAPCVVALEALRGLGCLNTIESVGYATSGDVNGETARVVGYAGLLFR